MFRLSKSMSILLLNNVKRSFMIKSYSSMSKINGVVNKDADKNFSPIYKVSHMPFFIGLNKIKKYQSAALCCLIPVTISFNMLNYFSLEDIIYVSLVGFGLTAGLHIASWLVSNNLVVFVYLSEDEQKCRMSYISYWGNREELFCNTEDIKPIECSKSLVSKFLNHKVNLKDNENTYKIITFDATILNNAKFRRVFGENII